MSVSVSTRRCPLRPEEDVKLELQEVVKLLMWVLEGNSGPLEEQQALVTPETFLRPPLCFEIHFILCLSTYVCVHTHRRCLLRLGEPGLLELRLRVVAVSPRVGEMPCACWEPNLGSCSQSY